VFWGFSHLLFSAPLHVLGDAGGPLWLLPGIEVGPSTLFFIGPFPVTNTLINSWLSILIVLVLFLGATRKMAIVPKGLQNFVEWGAGLLIDFCEEVAGKPWGRRFFPFVATIFFYLLFANWTEIIPGVDSLGTPLPGTHPVAGIFLLGNDSNKFVPWIRPASSDLNFTLAIALISVIVTQIYGFRTLGFRTHVGKYLNFRDPIGFIVGILEIVAEFARIISFSFRLFGNVFAGDVLLIVLGTLLPFIGPTVFYPLELFVGFIQAFVFSALTLVFLSLAITSHEDEHATAAHGTHTEHSEVGELASADAVQ
jgi:F-type H+-transporting ATPase subunit a